jgi:hypothetical protein
MTMTYTVEETETLYNDFDKTKILSPKFIKLFNEIRYKNKFNPQKFSKNNINFNNWKKSLSKEEEGKRNERDILCDKIRNLLNKCTNTNFDPLKVKLQEYIKDNTEILDVTLDYIFEMATFQSIYCQVYAKLCKYLNGIYGESIKSQILQKCKERFRTHKKLEACDEEDEYDLFCRVMKQKKMFVGMFNLVSYLYVVDMVDNVVIDKYLDLLISELNTNLNDETKNEYVECLKTLFINVHKKLKKDIGTQEFNVYVDNIKQLSVNKKFNNRDKFKFMDILELLD